MVYDKECSKELDAAKILSIIPAIGWRVAFSSDGKLLIRPFPCFALLELKNGSTCVVGMDALDDDPGKMLAPVETYEDFIGYVGPGEPLEKWEDIAKQFRKDSA